MVHDHRVQPRQIYASTLTRRERRARLRPSTRGRPLSLVLRTAVAMCAALTVLAIVVSGVA